MRHRLLLVALVASAPALAGSGLRAQEQGQLPDLLPPVADPGGPYSGRVGTPVTFDGSGSFDPGGGDIEEHEWDFDDGDDAEGEIVSHTFFETGTYRIRLKVEDDEGDEDEAETTAVILPPDQPPTGSIDAPAGDRTIQAGDTVEFRGTGSDPDGGTVTFAWTFDGGIPGSSSLEDPGPVRFLAPGTRTVTLQVRDEEGNTVQDTRTITVTPAPAPPTASIDAPPAGHTVEVGQPVDFRGSGSDPDGGAVTFLWTFPDGSPPTSTNEDQDDVTFGTPGTKTVRLRVTDDESSSTEVTRSITVTPVGGGGSPPTATITSPDRNVSIAAGGSVSFAGDGRDPDGGSVTFAWVFQGGTPSTSSERIPGSVSFLSPGTHLVTLTVRDNEGETAQAQRSIFVAAANQPPQATINQPEDETVVIPPGGSVNFAGSATDADGSIVSYSWSFEGGDPATSGAEDPGEVTFADAGVHQVEFTATDDDGATSEPERRTIVASAGVDAASLNVDRTSPGSQNRVDGHDAIFVLRAVGTQDPTADLNQDGVVDEVDVQLVISALGQVP